MNLATTIGKSGGQCKGSTPLPVLEHQCVEGFVEGASCMGLRALGVGTLKFEGSV